MRAERQEELQLCGETAGGDGIGWLLSAWLAPSYPQDMQTGVTGNGHNANNVGRELADCHVRSVVMDENHHAGKDMVDV